MPESYPQGFTKECLETPYLDGHNCSLQVKHLGQHIDCFSPCKLGVFGTLKTRLQQLSIKVCYS